MILLGRHWVCVGRLSMVPLLSPGLWAMFHLAPLLALGLLLCEHVCRGHSCSWVWASCCGIGTFLDEELPVSCLWRLPEPSGCLLPLRFLLGSSLGCPPWLAGCYCLYLTVAHFVRSHLCLSRWTEVALGQVPSSIDWCLFWMCLRPDCALVALWTNACSRMCPGLFLFPS